MAYEVVVLNSRADFPALTKLSSRLHHMLQGKYEAADPLYVRASEIEEKALGPAHERVALTLDSRAGLLEGQVRACRFFMNFRMAHLFR